MSNIDYFHNTLAHQVDSQTGICITCEHNEYQRRIKMESFSNNGISEVVEYKSTFRTRVCIVLARKMTDSLHSYSRVGTNSGQLLFDRMVDMFDAMSDEELLQILGDNNG